jgi:manganese-dependent inorganic pyrophosphatase
MPVYVIGHRNPDTDAVCSAIGYAHLLRRTTQPDAVAAICGAPNSRTQFVLEQSRVEPPRLLMDVRPTCGSVCRRAPLYAQIEETVHDVFDRMRKHRLKSLPVVDRNDRVFGMLFLVDLLSVLLPEASDLVGYRQVFTSLERVRNVLGGTFLNEVDVERSENLTLMVAGMRAEGYGERLKDYDASSLIVVVGNRTTIQEPSIEFGVRALIITGGFAVSDDLLARAKEKDVTILSSPRDTATTTLLVRSSKIVRDAIVTDILRFGPRDPIDDVRVAVQRAQQDLFPVVDDDGKLEGVFSKSDLLSPQKARLVLVDHNEFAQAVPGAEDAEILEVIDHHRIGGGLVSREPIRFLNDPVGSTCTIVTRMFREHAILPEKSVALCLASGIIADTLQLTSPTTTEVDRDMLGWLAPYTGRDLKAYAKEFFAAGSALRVKSPEAVLTEDCKEYSEGGWRFSVAQVEELGLELFWQRKEDLSAALDEQIRKSGLDFGCLMVTDITRHSSFLLVRGDDRVIDAIDYPKHERWLYELNGVVSRKKQLLPHLMLTIARARRDDEE